MEKKSNSNITRSDVYRKLESLSAKGQIPQKYDLILKDFFNSYLAVLDSSGQDSKKALSIFDMFFDLITEQIKKPFAFEPYHKRIRKPFDYYAFGLNFIRPLIDLPHSTILGRDSLSTIAQQLGQGENVILFANHQIEADPQVISILLEKIYPKIGEEMIFVAGSRVISDPFAIPFSMGCNLLCIHSKKYIDNPPDLKHEKQLHNKRTMEKMVQLLHEGGHAIYVAPSGGRDRANKQGIIELAPFDPQSVEMVYLMAKKAKKPTHFYTLALSTYHILPPPETTKIELGETRISRGGAVHIAFSEEVDMECFPGYDKMIDKRELRKKRADYLWNIVKKNYDKFLEED